MIKEFGADLVHVDVMDGHFVPNLTIGAPVVKSLRRATDMPLDCHLMIDNPELFVDEFVKIGARYVTVQAESTIHLDRLLNRIRELGAKPAVSINPATPIENIKWVLDSVDMVLVMSVNPGFGGQSLIPYCLDKIRALREMKPELDIEIDGGIKLDNILEAKKAGANIFVVGSAIFKTNSPELTCREFVGTVSA